MGCNTSSTPQERDNSHKIDSQLVKQANHIRNETKLLLLGTGESGKTTIIKQLRHIFDKEFSNEEINNYRTIINTNIISSMNTLALAIIEDGLIKQAPELREQATLMSNRDMATSSDLNPDIAKAIRELWAHKIVKARFVNRSDLQIIDSAGYFFDKIDQIATPDFRPTPQEIMLCRARTIGINEICFKLTGRSLRLVDVGGQRSERRKWIHCFEGVTAIFFIVALSEYDQVLREDGTTNRLQESMSLYSEITQIPFFAKTPILLFFNKRDLFAEKIKRVPVKNHFPEFTGGEDYNAALKYFEKEYRSLPKNGTPLSQKQVHVHDTCATDSENIKFVFRACQTIFMGEIVANVF